MFAVPLDALPGVLAGTGNLQDVTSLGQATPDKTGAAGFEGAAISGDGHYAFYLVEARSPLAPASVWDPASTSWYLVRESVTPPTTIQLASFGTDGNPIPVNGPVNDTVTTNEDGSAVAFDPSFDGIVSSGYTTVESEYVHDFATNATWQIGPPSGYTMTMSGLAVNGTAAFTAQQETNNNPQFHVYVQPMNGTARQIDHCTSADSTEYCGWYASISSDGNLVAYNGPVGSNGGASVYLYNASTGSNADLFPANTQAGNGLYDPVLSGDGTHIAMNFEPILGYINNNGVVLKTVGGSAVTASDIVAPYDNDISYSYPVSLSSNGSVLAYAAENLTQYTANYDGNQTSFMVDANGTTVTAPALSYANAECSGGGPSADVTSSGSDLLYAECLPELSETANYNNYPGVYEWQLP
jgi:hypothetical protein